MTVANLMGLKCDMQRGNKCGDNSIGSKTGSPVWILPAAKITMVNHLVDALFYSL